MGMVNFCLRDSQIKNGGLDVLLCVDGLWVSRGFLTCLSAETVFKGSRYCWNQCPYNIWRRY